MHDEYAVIFNGVTCFGVMTLIFSENKLCTTKNWLIIDVRIRKLTK